MTAWTDRRCKSEQAVLTDEEFASISRSPRYFDSNSESPASRHPWFKRKLLFGALDDFLGILALQEKLPRFKAHHFLGG